MFPNLACDTRFEETNLSYRLQDTLVIRERDYR